METGDTKRLLALHKKRKMMKEERTPVLITFVDGGVSWAILNGIGQVDMVAPVPRPQTKVGEVTPEQLEWVKLWRKHAVEVAALPLDLDGKGDADGD